MQYMIIRSTQPHARQTNEQKSAIIQAHVKTVK